MEAWSHPQNRDYFVALAAEFELDVDAFATCLTEDEPAQAVKSDMEAGAPFVRGTPTFVVLYGGEGRLIPGALPADQFAAALTEMLAEISLEGGDSGE